MDRMEKLLDRLVVPKVIQLKVRLPLPALVCALTSLNQVGAQVMLIKVGPSFGPRYYSLHDVL